MFKSIARVAVGLAALGYLAAIGLTAQTGPIRTAGPINMSSGGGSVVGGTCGAGEFVNVISVTGAPTCGVPAGGGDALQSLPLSQFAATTSLELKTTLSDETGSGAAVFATSPTLVTPILGTPTSGTLTNTTGFPLAQLAGAGSGFLTFGATPSSANLRGTLTDETGTGVAVFADSPVFVDDFDLVSTGVRASAADGVWTFLGLGNGADESLTIDLDNAGANVIALSSGTGANILSWSGFLVLSDALQADGIRTAYTSGSSNVSLTSANDFYDCESNSFTVTLPDPSTVGTQEFTVKNEQTLNTCTVQSAAGTIDGDASVDVADGALTFKSNGVDEYRIKSSLGAQVTPVAGAVMYTTAATVGTTLAGTSGQALISGGTGSPTWYNPTATRCLIAGTGGILADDDGCTFNTTTDILTLVGGADLLTTGARVSGSDGVFTVLGLGNGNDESLTIDLDNAAANVIALASGTGATFLTSTMGLVVNSTDTTTSTAKIQLAADNSTAFMAVLRYQASAGGPSYVGYKARGSGAAPRRALTGDALLTFSGISGVAADNSSTASFGTASAQFNFLAAEDQTASAKGSKLTLNLVPLSSTTLYTKLTASENDFTISNQSRTQASITNNAINFYNNAGSEALTKINFHSGSRPGSDEVNTSTILVQSTRDTTDDWFNSLLRYSVHDGSNAHDMFEWIAEGQINGSGTFTNGPWLAIYDAINDKTPFLYDASSQITGIWGAGLNISVSDSSHDGVQLSAADGVLTILGNGNGNDENLVWDFDNATANTIGLSSGTGVTSLVYTGIGLTTTTALSAATYNTATNCSDSAGAAACGSATAGSVVIDASATTVVVSTTNVTANSQIFVQEDPSLATRLSVTCNTTTGRVYTVTARTAATSFTITTSAAPVTNPACLNYRIVN